jgi:hypothetical protein
MIMSSDKDNPSGIENDESSISRRQVISSMAAMSAGAAIPSFAKHMKQESEVSKEPIEVYNTPIYSTNRPGASGQFTTFNPKTKEKAYPVQPGEKKDAGKLRRNRYYQPHMDDFFGLVLGILETRR